MTAEEEIFIHYAKSYVTARLGVTVTAAVPFKETLPRHSTACLLGVIDGDSQASPKTKTQLVQAVEALLV